MSNTNDERKDIQEVNESSSEDENLYLFTTKTLKTS